MSNTITDYLVSRYGPEILTVRRHDMPLRKAQPKHQLAVVPKGGQRRKLEKELRREGYKAHVARHRVDKDVTANLVFTNALPAFNKHARAVLAELPNKAVLTLYGRRPPAEYVKPYEVGDVIKVKAGVFAGSIGPLVERKAKASWLVETGGKRFVVHINNMIRIDPG